MINNKYLFFSSRHFFKILIFLIFVQMHALQKADKREREKVDKKKSRNISYD